jgi:hypothetical protein
VEKEDRIERKTLTLALSQLEREQNNRSKPPMKVFGPIQEFDRAFNWEAVNPHTLAHLKSKLRTMGEIKPWFDDAILRWVYTHALFRLYGVGRTPEEAIDHYKQLMVAKIEDNIQNRRQPLELFYRCYGGYRKNAGRPRKLIPCIRISIPKDIGIWVKREAPWEALRQLKETLENQHSPKVGDT